MNSRLLKRTLSLIHADHVQLDKHWNYSNVISPYYRIYYIDEGEGYILNGKEKILLEPGYFYMIPSFTLCGLHCDTYLSQYFIHFFEESTESISLFEYSRKVIRVKARETDITNMQRLAAINPGRGINRSDNPKVYEKQAYYAHYKELNEKVSHSVYVETQGILLQFISIFMDTPAYTGANTAPAPSKILEAIAYIQLNLKAPLTVASIAKQMNLHHDYFSRLFLQFTGERPINFIHTKRIERAQYLIATTNLPYSAIAEETGFENTPYFCRIFKKITRMTPGAYKKQNNISFTSR
ncbi:MAG: helix-turn-helix domain-containing protein [Chitinophagaceae bacterium]